MKQQRKKCCFLNMWGHKEAKKYPSIKYGALILADFAQNKAESTFMSLFVIEKWNSTGQILTSNKNKNSGVGW